MSGATFVVCPGCGRLMLGQRAGGAVYPQPHKCTATTTPPPNPSTTEGETA